MSVATQSIDHYTAEAARAQAAFAGNHLAWLRELRGSALDYFAARGFPAPRDEEWKYTRTLPIERRAFTYVPAAPLVDADALRASPLLEALPSRIVFVNGRFSPAFSRLNGLPRGVVVDNLADAFATRAALLEGYLGRVADIEKYPFAALNTAFVNEGTLVLVPKDMMLEAPLHILFVNTASAEARMTHPRVLVVAEEGSCATIIESHLGLADTPYFANALTEINLGANAAVEHCRVQQEGASAYHVGGVHVRQASDSRFISHSIALGALLARVEIDALLSAPGVSCVLNGLYMADGRQHVDHHTRIDHAHPHGSSSELYKGILAGHARGVFDGRIIVREGAQHTDARQNNHNLLLSTEAEADSRPVLEIYTDDVKCAHGATVGQLDEDAVFYLRSRGVNEQTARALLTYAFAGSIIEQVTPALHTYLKQAVLTRLPGGITGGELP